MLVDTFQNRLKQAMLEAGFKQVDLVKRTKLDKTLINKYLAGISRARQKKLTILADTLQVSEVWLMGYDVPKNNLTTSIPQTVSTTIPLVKTLSPSISHHDASNVIAHIDFPESLAKMGDFIALKVKDNSMASSFLENDILIIKLQENFEDNNLVVVSVGNENAVLRKIKKTDTGILLQCLNLSYNSTFYTKEEINSLPITIFGVVKQLKRDF